MPKKTIITCIQNILPLFTTNLKHNLKLHNNLIFTNKYNSTLHNYKTQINQITRLNNCRFVSNYQPALSYLRDRIKNGGNVGNVGRQGQGQQAILLVGEPGEASFQQIKKQKVLTLNQICGLFPEKVPLSYRSRQNLQLRKKIQARIGMPLDKQPHINKILYTSQQIKMWDQAIQVIIDHQPSQNIIQFEHPEPRSTFYRLTMQDFIKGLQKSYQIVHHHDLPNIVDFNKQNRQIQWFINKILTQSKQNQNKNQCKDNKQQLLNIIVDEDLVNNADQLQSKYQQVIIQRVDQNSSLWV